MKKIPHPEVNPYEQNRKKIRWENYDYSQSGIYYVTRCTYDRICYFRKIDSEDLTLLPQGSLAEAFLSVMPVFYPDVEVINYVVRPDHIHLLLLLHNEEADLRAFEQANELDVDVWKLRHQKETLSSIIANYKSSITRHCHRQHFEMKWQRGFYDRVIRNSEELAAFNKYINENLQYWGIEKTVNPMGWPK